MNAIKKKQTFLKKEVSFGGKSLVLYSIDGNTWSTRKDELIAILERHEAEKITFGEIKGGVAHGSGSKPAKAAKKSGDDDEKPVELSADYEKDSEDEEASKEDLVDPILEDIDIDLDLTKPKGKVTGKQALNQKEVVKPGPIKASAKSKAKPEKAKKPMPSKNKKQAALPKARVTSKPKKKVAKKAGKRAA